MSKYIFALEDNASFQFTNTRDSISRVSRMTRAEEGAFSVGTVGISVAVVGVIATMVHS